MRQEKLTYFSVEVGSKQFVRILLRASSRGPLQRARIALEPLFTPRDPERILPEVREYFIQNALYWLMEFRFDGLRFDAVHAISEESFLEELAAQELLLFEP